ncbi:MAG: UpxY family transcription antiterminator [Candidatus Marinimicrobia bacterium]|jgi:transcription antitermination factor NusG|nr:UpxY family transcription antiterminator [Candidatus Neomarinimicrobiota bacterium]MBT3675620.1 UpxY family transcription antiterminator [Candidatus Neomarinimicrobiota bacterium]MBT3762545.1 UpxY family transcription antiterminator [Candidatus Neomarinimicrobiota bacterium]MBT4270013.1 UpxY family transcription antiterminator [Candidatus Neomarinimicrobiota bacterium]MBT6637864.1 UpxY family transcription antiterminator [Candidatus Neomarinimicrobiota bacterium]
MEQHWIAVRSKPRAEKVALQQLEKNGIEAYLPLVRQKRKWSDRMKWVELPLLSSYLFARIELKNSIFVLETHGISTIVKFSGSIAIVQDEVIKSIRLALEGGYELEPTEYFSVGDEVEVFEGPMKGTKGIVLQIKGEDRLVIKIDALQQAIAVHIDLKFLQSVGKKRAPIL